MQDINWYPASLFCNAIPPSWDYAPFSVSHIRLLQFNKFQPLRWDFPPKAPMLSYVNFWLELCSYISIPVINYNRPVSHYRISILTLSSNKLIPAQGPAPTLPLVRSSTVSAPLDSATILLRSTLYTRYQRPQSYNQPTQSCTLTNGSSPLLLVTVPLPVTWWLNNLPEANYQKGTFSWLFA